MAESNLPKNKMTEPVPRYEFEEAKREMYAVRKKAEDDHTEFKNDIRDINKRLEENYYTKDGVRDQFKIELSDYKAIKAILVAVGLATLGLVFAVVQQYIINTGAR